MRRRIRELLSIPERDRTDAEWDELNELEIRTAPGNRDYDRPQERQMEKRQGGQGAMGLGRRVDRNKQQQGNKNNNNNNNGPRQQSDGRPEGRNMLKRQHRRPKRQTDNFNSGGNSGNFVPVESMPSTPNPDSDKGEG